MAKVKKYGMGGLGGVIPELMDALGPKNKGFAFGVLPGLFQRERYEDKMAEEAAKNAAAQEAAKVAAIRAAAESNQGQRQGMKKGGAVSASRRADGIAARGKTRGKMI